LAVALILSFFILLVGGMFISGGVTVSLLNIAVLMTVLTIVGVSLYEMFRLLQADE